MFGSYKRKKKKEKRKEKKSPAVFTLKLQDSNTNSKSVLNFILKPIQDQNSPVFLLVLFLQMFYVLRNALGLLCFFFYTCVQMPFYMDVFIQYWPSFLLFFLSFFFFYFIPVTHSQRLSPSQRKG